jgi:enolase
MDLKIVDLVAYQIYDSRGKPTIEVELTTKDGKFKASVPSGASTGKYEAVELRDTEKEGFDSLGVTRAIKNINEIIKPALLKADVSINQQKIIDKIMNNLDGTDNKSYCYLINR